MNPSRGSLNRLTAIELAGALERHEATVTDIVRSCVERIEERNDEVGAFVAFDPRRALQEAAHAEQSRTGPARLRGIPYAAKDIIDTAGYPTEYGSAIYGGFRPAGDAACITLARHQGAVLLGKVATSEFATQTPAATRNPLRLSHTPGGSSSGSAAAVADHMVPIALGSQTTGSILRPAAYCGVVGYKPSFDLISPHGMRPLSPSQDTLGVLTRTVDDAAFFTLGLHGATGPDQAPGRRRLGLCVSSQWSHLSSESTAAIERFVIRLEKAGHAVQRLVLPPWLEDLIPLQARLFMFEARCTLAHERLARHRDLSARLQARLAAGQDISLQDYMAMRRQVGQARQRMAELLQDLDALIYPAADGEAEEGTADSGSPRFGALWSLLHLPSVCLPIDLGPRGLPLGVQLVGDYMCDTALLATAALIEREIRRYG